MSVIVLGGGQTGAYALRACLGAGIDVRLAIARKSIPVDSGDQFVDAAESLQIPTLHGGIPPWTVLARQFPQHTVDYILSVQYDRLIPKETLAIPEKGSLNVHFGPLPRLRGCFPTKWAIINGEDSGVTVHHLDDGIDTGPVVLQRVVEVTTTDTDKTLYARLCDVADRLMDELVQLLKENAVPEGQVQDEAAATYHSLELPWGGLIDWSLSADAVERFVRANTFPPYPGAMLDLGFPELQIRAPIGVKLVGKQLEPAGSFTLDGDVLAVVCADGRIETHQAMLGDSAVGASELRALIGASGRFSVKS